MRLAPQVRKMQILLVAKHFALSKGYRNVTRHEIARRAKCSVSLISYHFKDCENLHSAIMTDAVRDQDLKILAQGIIAGDPIAVAAPRSLKSRAIREALR